MKAIKEFIKSNKLITMIFGFSVFIIISYILSMDSLEWFDGAERWFNLGSQLSVGFIISFIFYITQVYVPNRKRDKSAKKCVCTRIDNIIKEMNNSISMLAQCYIPNHNVGTYTEEELKQLMNLKFSDFVNVTNAATLNRFTVREWINKCINDTETEIDKLYKYYPNYITAELMDVLEKVINCTYHRVMSILVTNSNVTFSGSNDCFFVEYYELMKVLKEIKTKEYI